MIYETDHHYIVRVDGILSREPVIRGTRTPVRAIVENVRLGLHPEEIPDHLPHLTMGQVYDALSYYYDHPQEIEEYIELNRIPEELISPLVKGL